MRKLSEQFIQDLKEPDGMLHSVLERVKKDHTLTLAIRENFSISIIAGEISSISRSLLLVPIRLHLTSNTINQVFPFLNPHQRLLVKLTQKNGLNHSRFERASWMNISQSTENLRGNFNSCSHARTTILRFQTKVNTSYLISRLLNRTRVLISSLSGGWQISEKPAINVRLL